MRTWHPIVRFAPCGHGTHELHCATWGLFQIEFPIQLVLYLQIEIVPGVPTSNPICEHPPCTVDDASSTVLPFRAACYGSWILCRACGEIPGPSIWSVRATQNCEAARHRQYFLKLETVERHLLCCDVFRRYEVGVRRN